VTTFVLATANPDKAREIGEILGSGVALVPRPAEVPDVDETGDTLEANARLKAAALVEATGLPAIADDTGLEVAALGGAPGVRSARYAGEAAVAERNVTKLLAELAGHPEAAGRRARFRTVALARWPDGRELVAEGVVDGWIATERRGGAGFGYDPVFVPDELGGRTFAEVSAEAKHAVSHRGRAFRALADALAAVA
jgi:XTP/dITP diphosphohydrolase